MTTAPLPTSPTVDAIAVDRRAKSFTTRSIKRESKMDALRLALSMVDLTTLEGADSPEKVRSLCRKAVRPFERDEELLGERLPHVAAVCVYPAMVPHVAERLKGTGVKVASVATGFPSGQYPLSVRIADTEKAVADGADEIDMVINRGAFLSGRYGEVAEEIREVCAACGEAHLKVILETGELETYDNVRRASDIAIANIRPGDFIKTSTGKVSPAATMPVTLVMLEAIRDAYLDQNLVIGMKPAGGIRTAKQSWHYLCMVNETLGGAWLTPERFRFGASSLANDLLRAMVKLKTGRYPAGYDFSVA
ncbi:MAG: deoxyribose-phosphate aldolase [Phycisphaerales bacterium]